MSPRYYRDRLMRFWWLLLLCGVCAGLGGWVGGALLFTVYSSTALIQVDLRGTTPTASDAVVIDRLMHTGAQMAVSQGILTPIAAREGMSVAKLRGEVTAVPLGNTQLLAVTVRDASSSRAARLANAVATAVVGAQERGLAQANAQSQLPYVNELKTLSDSMTALRAHLAQLGQPPSDAAKASALQVQISAAQAQYDLTQGTLSRIQAAEAAGSPTTRVASLAQSSGMPVISHQIATALGGAVFGLALGVFLVVGGEWLNMRVQSPDGVAAAFEWVRLGAAHASSGVGADANRSEDVSDTVRALARDIDFLGLDRPLRVLALVSANPSTRTNELAGRLADTLAQKGRSTLLVDAHLRDGALSEAFGTPAEPGLSDLILHSKGAPPSAQALMSLLRPPAQNGSSYLRLLPVGSKSPKPNQTLASASCKVAVAAIVTLPAEVVLFSAPATMFGGESASLASAFDGAIVLIDPATARQGDLAALRKTIASSLVPILGFVYVDGSMTGSGSHMSAPGSHAVREPHLVER